MRWAEHVTRNGTVGIVHVLVANPPEMKAPFGKSKYVRDNNEMNLK
jgi:hypothetical protein